MFLEGTKESKEIAHFWFGGVFLGVFVWRQTCTLMSGSGKDFRLALDTTRRTCEESACYIHLFGMAGEVRSVLCAGETYIRHQGTSA